MATENETNKEPVEVKRKRRRNTYKPTDDELGDRLVEAFDGLTRFFYGQWNQYNGGIWVRADQPVKLATWNVLIEAKSEGIRPADGKVKSVLEYTKVQLSTEDNMIDRPSGYINLRDGLMNLETMKMEPHRPDMFHTSQLPFSYDPKASCPTFIKFLTSVLVREDGKVDGQLMSLVAEAFGYSLTMDTSHRVSFWLVGESGTGKSTLMDVLIALAGDAHTTIDLDQLGKNDYQLADLAGKRVATFTEPDSRTVLSDSHYKRLVSQDVMMARQIFGKPFRFIPICKVWGAMNETPRIVDRSDAVYNRLIIIPMNRVVPQSQRDLNLKAKLDAELPGIFNWALAGLRELRKRGRFTVAEASETARDDYKLENDTEKAFSLEWIIRDKDDEKNNVRANRLYEAYQIWCKRNGLLAKSSTRVARDWGRLGFTKRRDNQGMFYEGLRLSSDAFKATEFVK